MFLNVKLNTRSATGYFISAYVIVTILAYLASYLVSVFIRLPPDPRKRLRITVYLNIVAFNYTENQPPRLDKSKFKAKSRNG